jgi:CubicO group peptidase (beta-lactamase class C family)
MKCLWLGLAAAIASAAPNPSMLVSGDWLAAHLKDESLVILHVGSQRDYDAGHIAGARLVTLADISITDASGLRLELPPAAALAEAFGKLGVTDTSRIIVYAGNPSVQSATRVWFTLDYLGAGDRAALLDGGISAWRAAGRPVSTDASAAQPGKFTPHPRPELVVNADWVRAHLGDKTVQLIDARTLEFYVGTDPGGMPRAGHIPGARNVPYERLLGEHGKLQGTETLASPAALTVSYCHIGQQATVIYFAARYQGLEARLYDGSFQDWSRRPELPVELELAGKIDTIFAPLVEGRSPGVAVLVRSQGRTIFERGYGIVNLKAPAKIDAHTNFRLASFTKQFTAMAVMLLVHDRKLAYDRPLTAIFPEFPAWGRAITVRHLLNHTSGLPDYENAMGTDGWSPTHQITDHQVLELLAKQPGTRFAPGSKFEYSNSGYVLLGLIVEKVSGKSYPDFLHERIFAPLHMDNTVVFVNGHNKVANRAYGYSREADHFVDTDQSPTSATLGDGGIYSNLTDLAKWDDALEHYSLLSEREMSEALRPSPLKAYGFGWFLDPYKGHARMYHTGSTSGFRTVIERFTDDKLSIIVLSNRTDVDAEKLALAAADIVLR